MKDIKTKTNKLLNQVKESIEWANSMDDVSTKDSLISEFKSVERSLLTIDNSLKKRPSIAIFGQSQVGKSYLVQNLTKPSDSKFLMIKASSKDDNINFLTEMNPDGGRESTGLVTRFTTQEIEDDPDFPIHIDLFGQLDIAAILINGFWSDLKDYDDNTFEFNIDEIKEKFNELNNGHKALGISENDTYFFIQYIKTHFNDINLIRDLNRTEYFKDLAKNLHLIPAEERWQVLHFLWGKNKFFTQIFKNFTENLKALDFQKEIRIELAGLTPNNTTIIDVERVREIFKPENETDTVEVKLKSGRTVQIQRSYLSAITKEVQLQLSNSFDENSKQAFLNTADILDFPGSRSREKIPLDVFNNNSTEDKLQIFIRGKVSYLFDSYSNQFMVSTLLYCLDDNQSEEKEAPSRLHKWVQMYVGKNPTDRTETLSKTKEILQNINIHVDKISPLLVVFTKFNQEINKVMPGEETNLEKHDSKWRARFEENFVNFMSRPVEDKWITNWTKEDNNFKFIFPVRDPLYSQATFDGFEFENRETNIRPERVKAMDAMETSFTNSKVVNDHTLSSQKIWDELSRPNGTGLDFLSEHLKHSSHEVFTKTRLNLELNKIQNELLGIIKPYQVSGNLQEDLINARKNALRAHTSLVALANRKDNTLINILSAMIVSDTEIWNLLYSYVFGKKDEEEFIDENTELIGGFNDLGIKLNSGMSLQAIWQQLKEVYEGISEEEINDLIFDMFEINVEDIPSLISNNENIDSEELLAELVITHWIEKLMKTSLHNKYLDNLNDRQKFAFSGLISEIIKGKERFKLRKYISETIKNIKIGAISVEDIDLVASCCSTILNKYLFSAGWSLSDENSKPQLNGKHIFSEYGKEYKLDELNYSSDSERTFFKEWSEGIKVLYEENVMFKHNNLESEFNIENNNKLNAIVESLTH